MFDVPLAEKATERFQVELPDRDEAVAHRPDRRPVGQRQEHGRAASFFGDELYHGAEWPADRAVIDCFGELPVRQVVELFTAVGFSSPPSWVKPYQVLSGGERFRCDLARALATGCRVASRGVASTERQRRTPTRDSNSRTCPSSSSTNSPASSIATSPRSCSAAIAKGIRRGHIPCRFVAVTCHYDVAEWLEPIGCSTWPRASLQRRRLRRPTIELEIHRCRLAAWQLFARHHYLSGSLAVGARCYLATWNGEPVTFCATLPVIAKKNHRRFTRIVTLPDYQGMGIGMRVVAAVADAASRRGTADQRHQQPSGADPPLPPLAAVEDGEREESRADRRAARAVSGYRSAAGRAVVSFEYVGGVGCQSSDPH